MWLSKSQFQLQVREALKLIDLQALGGGATEVGIGDSGRLDQVNWAAEQGFEIELQAHVALE